MTWPPLRAWLPARLTVGPTERARAALGAALGLLLTGLLSRWVESHWTGATVPWLVAPLGASAVLVFAVPASPLAQPWSVVGGNTISALIGLACAHLIPDPAWAAAIAVGLAIGAMFALRCLHPPGGAMALLTALAGAGSFGFAWFPACFNSVLLVLAGAAYNSATRRPYPHAQLAAPPGPGGDETHRFSDADLDAVLERYGQVIDVSRDDLVALLHAAEAEAYRRRFGATLCADIMTHEVVTVSFGTELQDAWALLREHRIKALPVVDRARRVVGIVTLADFLRHADLDIHEGWSARLRSFIRRTPATHSDKPEVVGQIMTRQVRVASEDRPVAELVPLFAQGGHHHIPIVGPEARLVGMLTQSDVVSALSRVS